MLSYRLLCIWLIYSKWMKAAGMRRLPNVLMNSRWLVPTLTCHRGQWYYKLHNWSSKADAIYPFIWKPSRSFTSLWFYCWNKGYYSMFVSLFCFSWPLTKLHQSCGGEQFLTNASEFYFKTFKKKQQRGGDDQWCHSNLTTFFSDERSNKLIFPNQ